MLVTINGEETTLTRVRTVADLVKYLDISGRIAVEINREIVPSNEFDSHVIQDGDIIEIVHAIGGGCPCIIEM